MCQQARLQTKYVVFITFFMIEIQLCLPGPEACEKMEPLLNEAKSAGDRLMKDLLKVTSKVDKNDTKMQNQLNLVLKMCT